MKRYQTQLKVPIQKQSSDTPKADSTNLPVYSPNTFSNMRKMINNVKNKNG